MKFLILILLVSNASWAQKQDNDHVQYCRSLHQIPFRNLLEAKVPTMPDALSVNHDGSWHFSLPVQEVYALYTTTPMSKAWASKYIVNRFSLPLGSSEPIDVDQKWYDSKKSSWAKDWPALPMPQAWPGLIQGTRIYLDIKGALLNHSCDMAIGFEVTQTIPNQMIELKYLDFSPPYGVQRITFKEDGKGGTVVSQISYYKGKDPVLHLLYRPFHREEIPGLHERMQELAVKKAVTIAHP